MAEALIDAGYDQEGEQLFAEVLLLLQPLYSAHEDSKRSDMSGAIMLGAFRIANIQGKLGRHDKVEESLKMIEDLLGISKPMEPWVYLVESQLKVGEIHKARKAAKSAAANVLSEIATLQARFGISMGQRQVMQYTNVIGIRMFLFKRI